MRGSCQNTSSEQGMNSDGCICNNNRSICYRTGGTLRSIQCCCFVCMLVKDALINCRLQRPADQQLSDTWANGKVDEKQDLREVI